MKMQNITFTGGKAQPFILTVRRVAPQAAEKLASKTAVEPDALTAIDTEMKEEFKRTGTIPERFDSILELQNLIDLAKAGYLSFGKDAH